MNDLSNADALNVVAQTLADNRRRLSLCSGNVLLLWGYVCVVVSLLVWVCLWVFNHPAFNFLFFLIWVVCGTLTPHLVRKQRAERGAVTSLETTLNRSWSAVGWAAVVMTFACLGLMLFAGKDAWAAMLLYAFVVVGFMLTVQGIALRERWSTCGGAVGFAIGLILTAVVCAGIPLAAQWVMPTIIVGFVAMFIVPGHVLNHKYAQVCHSTN